MAQHNTRARIERVLSNKQSGTGVLKAAGWMLILTLATPVLYSAVAIQVSSEHTPVLIAEAVPTESRQQQQPAEVAAAPPALASTPSQPKVQNLLRPQPEPVQPPLQASPLGEIRLVTNQSPRNAYVIKAGDGLNVSVWKEPAVSTRVTVQPDGRISIPLAQDILAAGSTPAQLKEAIEQRLKRFIDEPIVTVIVESISSFQVFVVGKVNKPGELRSEKSLTILQALALAGGFQPFAKQDEITIFRSGETAEETRRYLFNYSDLVSGKDMRANLNLNNGDVVVVP